MYSFMHRYIINLCMFIVTSVRSEGPIHLGSCTKYDLSGTTSNARFYSFQGLLIVMQWLVRFGLCLSATFFVGL